MKETQYYQSCQLGGGWDEMKVVQLKGCEPLAGISRGGMTANGNPAALSIDDLHSGCGIQISYFAISS